jgi:hypothetical protein
MKQECTPMFVGTNERTDGWMNAFGMSRHHGLLSCGNLHNPADKAALLIAQRFVFRGFTL